ncbi:unnamed protein product [Caenorhabditis bovis]|uniref:Uncharacterized protein n=1 Tax=Caenorhabditis bovis TaxID=2654633 RepID=A0A8S1FF74_9PELO|nr:unnamed protein product [Caenorhabditis bovis]
MNQSAKRKTSETNKRETNEKKFETNVKAAKDEISEKGAIEKASKGNVAAEPFAKELVSMTCVNGKSVDSYANGRTSKGVNIGSSSKKKTEENCDGSYLKEFEWEAACLLHVCPSWFNLMTIKEYTDLFKFQIHMEVRYLRSYQIEILRMDLLPTNMKKLTEPSRVVNISSCEFDVVGHRDYRELFTEMQVYLTTLLKFTNLFIEFDDARLSFLRF